MSRKSAVQPVVERALAIANAAVDEPTEHRIKIARVAADSALERVCSFDFLRSEARMIVVLVGELRAVLRVLERRASPPFNRLAMN
jgi:hypothetical protein